MRPSASTVESPVSITCVTPWSRGFAGRCGRSRKSGTAETLAAARDRPEAPRVRPADAGARLSRTQAPSQCGALAGVEDADRRVPAPTDVRGGFPVDLLGATMPIWGPDESRPRPRWPQALWRR